MFGATIRTCEQRILPVKRDRADGAFDGVVVELDAAVIDEARHLPSATGVPDGLGELALLTDQSNFCLQPWFKGIDERLTFLLPSGAALIRAAATDVFLDGVESAAICSSASLAIGAGPGVASS